PVRRLHRLPVLRADPATSRGVIGGWPDGETAVSVGGRPAAPWPSHAYDPLHYELSAPAGAATPARSHPADAQTSRDRGGSFCLRENLMTSTTPSGVDHPEDAFHVYDTTLRDGAQQEGLAFSVEDKLAV